MILLHHVASLSKGATADSWLVKAGGPGTDGLTGITLTPNGDILFTGLTGRGARFDAISIGDSTANGFFLARYNALGEPIWVKAASGDLTSRGLSVATDAQGNVYVTGKNRDLLQLGNGIYVSGTETQPGPEAPFTAAFSGSGEAQWAQPWIGALLEHPHGQALLNQASTAWEDSAVTSEFLLNIINIQGELFPIARGKQKTGSSLPGPFVLSVALSSNGTIWMAGARALRSQLEVTLGLEFSLLKINTNFSMGYLARFAPDGSPLSLLEHRHGQLAVDTHTNLFVVFRRPFEYGVYVEKYNSDGKLLWERAFDPQEYHGGGGETIFTDPFSLAAGVSSIAVDPAGNLFFATSSLIRELNPDGDLIAQRQLEGAVNLARFRLLADGKVIVGGTFSGRLVIGDHEITSEGDHDIFLAKVALQPVVPVLLSWTRVGNGIILSWAKGFILQSTTRLDPANWHNESGLSPVTVSTQTGSQFFRLRSE